MTAKGEAIISGVQAIIDRHNVGHIFSLSGHPTWSFVLIKDVAPYSQWQIKTLFLQEMFARGILTFGTHNLSYAHSDADLQRLLTVYDEVLSLVGAAVNNQSLESHLRCQPLEPLFKVR
jgi:glutamate-1-semialdehyde 2,1-aminomutase